MKGVIKESFISIEAVERANADGILSAVEHALTDVAELGSTWQTKLVAGATDGASVNTGKKTGFLKQLKGSANQRRINLVADVAHATGPRLEGARASA